MTQLKEMEKNMLKTRFEVTNIKKVKRSMSKTNIFEAEKKTKLANSNTYSRRRAKTPYHRR